VGGNYFDGRLGPSVGNNSRQAGLAAVGQVRGAGPASLKRLPLLLDVGINPSLRMISRFKKTVKYSVAGSYHTTKNEIYRYFFKSGLWIRIVFNPKPVF
jgi:hypothetical protein